VGVRRGISSPEITVTMGNSISAREKQHMYNSREITFTKGNYNSAREKTHGLNFHSAKEELFGKKLSDEEL
jgi:hypothetical protein